MRDFVDNVIVTHNVRRVRYLNLNADKIETYKSGIINIKRF